MPGSPAHLVARFFDVAFARALTGSERAAVAAWLDPEQAAVFFSQSDADQRHGYEAALHLIADGVDSVEILSHHGGTGDFRVRSPGGFDLGARIYDAVAGGGWSLSALEPQMMSLEDVYLKLTASSPAGAARSRAAS